MTTRHLLHTWLLSQTASRPVVWSFSEILEGTSGFFYSYIYFLNVHLTFFFCPQFFCTHVTKKVCTWTIKKYTKIREPVVVGLLDLVTASHNHQKATEYIGHFCLGYNKEKKKEHFYAGVILTNTAGIFKIINCYLYLK